MRRLQSLSTGDILNDAGNFSDLVEIQKRDFAVRQICDVWHKINTLVLSNHTFIII